MEIAQAQSLCQLKSKNNLKSILNSLKTKWNFKCQLSLLTLLSMMFLMSCSADSDYDVNNVLTIDVNSFIQGQEIVDGAQVNADSTINFTINIVAESGFDYYSINLKIDNQEYSPIQQVTNADLSLSNSEVYVQDVSPFLIEKSLQNKTIWFQFQVVDQVGGMSQFELHFEII